MNKYNYPDDLFNADLATECKDNVCDQTIREQREKITIIELIF